MFSFWRPIDPMGRMVRANMSELTLLTLDYDGSERFSDVAQSLREKGLAYFAHHTFNSRANGNGNKDKFHVFIPIDQPIKLDEVTPELLDLIQTDFPECDRSAFSAARRFFMPTAPMARNVVFESGDGDPYQVSESISRANLEGRKNSLALSRICADEAGEAAKNGGGQFSFEVYDALAWFKGRGDYIRDKGNGWHKVRCPEGHLHSDGDQSADIFCEKDSLLWRYVCHHNHGGVKHDTAWLSRWMRSQLTDEEKARLVRHVRRQLCDLEGRFPGHTKSLEKRYLCRRVRIGDSLDFGIESLNDKSSTHLEFDWQGYDTIFIKSPKGTGKTEAFREISSAAESVLCITHRVALADELCKRVGLENYQRNVSGNRLGICIDSLGKLERNRCVRNFDVVILDECEQLLSHIVGPTNKARRLRIMSVFRHIIKNATTVICADADLSMGLSVSQILKHRRDANPLLVHNKVSSNERYYLYRSERDLLVSLFGQITAYPSKNYWVAVNAVERVALPVQAIAKQLGVGTLVITSATRDRPEVKKFLASPADYIRDNGVRLVIASPSISTGFNLDVYGLVERVYGVFHEKPLTAFDCDQAMHRVRKVESRHIWIHPGAGFSEVAVASQISAAMKELSDYTENTFTDYESAAHIQAQREFEDEMRSLVHAVEVHRAKFSCSRDQLLRELYSGAGATVHVFDSEVNNPDMLDQFDQIYDTEKLIVAAKSRRDILNARAINECEFRELSKLKVVPEKDKFALERAKIERALGREPGSLTEADLIDPWGKVRRRGNIRAILADEETAQARDRREIEAQRLVFDRKHYSKKSFLARAILSEAGTSISEITRKARMANSLREAFLREASEISHGSPEYKKAKASYRKSLREIAIEIGPERAAKAYGVMKGHGPVFNQLFGARHSFDGKGDVPKRMGKAIAGFFSAISVKVDSKKRKSGRVYVIDLLASYDQLVDFGCV